MNEARREYLKGHYQRNKDKYAASAKRYVAKNKQRVEAYRKTWRESNKDRVAQHCKDSRARAGIRKRLWGLMSQPGAEELLLARQNGCTYCGSLEQLELDHKHPQSRGGEHAVKNLQWLCLKCNRAKLDQTEEEFFEHIRKILTNECR